MHEHIEITDSLQPVRAYRTAVNTPHQERVELIGTSPSHHNPTRIVIIHTGGTIACSAHDRPLRPRFGAIELITSVARTGIAVETVKYVVPDRIAS